VTRRPLVALAYAGAVTVGLVAAVALADRALLPLLVRRGQTIRVPDLEGLHPGEAKNTLKRAKLKFLAAGEKFDAIVPEGTVCAQVPRAGSSVKPGRNIRVLLSRGTRKVGVPPLAGLPVDHARMVLAAAGLRSRTALTCPSSQFPGGTLIASSPTAGETVGTGGTVDFLVSDGAPRACYCLPDLRGRRMEDVAPLLQRRNLEYQGVARTAPFDAEPGLILQQEPRPGSSVCRGDTLILLISGGAGG
jgi:beta-lactam-binding protein with PASTA domain